MKKFRKTARSLIAMAVAVATIATFAVTASATTTVFPGEEMTNGTTKWHAAWAVGNTQSLDGYLRITRNNTSNPTSRVVHIHGMALSHPIRFSRFANPSVLPQNNHYPSNYPHRLAVNISREFIAVDATTGVQVGILSPASVAFPNGGITVNGSRNLTAFGSLTATISGTNTVVPYAVINW
jgi:hypothetical protein